MAALFKCKMVVGCTANWNPRFFSTTSQRLSQRCVLNRINHYLLLI